VNFKDLIVASEGKVLISRDQASAESVVVAYLANCAAMTTEFKKDEPDFHTLVAQLLHPLVTDKSFDSIADKAEKKRLRTAYKPVSHGGAYGLYSRMLQELLFTATGKFVKTEEAEILLESWHAAFPEIRKNWHAKVKQILDTEGWLVNAFGRKHTFGGVKSFNALNEMLAWEPQSTVPEITNIMLKWTYELAQSRPEMGIQLLQMGHDALLLEIFPHYVREYAQLFDCKSREIVLTYPSGQTFIKWDCSVGKTWGTMKNLKDWDAR